MPRYVLEAVEELGREAGGFVEVGLSALETNRGRFARKGIEIGARVTVVP